MRSALIIARIRLTISLYKSQFFSPRFSKKGYRSHEMECRVLRARFIRVPSDCQMRNIYDFSWANVCRH